MSKIKNSIGAGLFSVLIGLTGYAGTTYTEALVPGQNPVESHIPGGPASLKLSEDYKTAIQQKKNIGSQMVDLLKGEFDLVTYNLMKVEEKDGRIHEDLVLRFYEKDKDGYWPVLGFNFDNMCRSIMKEKKILYVIDVGDYLIAETGRGEIIKSPDMKHRIVRQLNQVASLYIGNNGEQCKYWVQFIQETTGPRGPVNTK